jgi:hypothetical protein
MEHSPTSATGTGRERTPWHATQRAAWEALNKGEPWWLGGAPFVLPHLETPDVQLLTLALDRTSRWLQRHGRGSNSGLADRIANVQRVNGVVPVGRFAEALHDLTDRYSLGR